MNFLNHLLTIWEIFLSALGYPFFSFNGIDVSLAALLKLAILLVFALLLLRRARRKAATVLVTKTRLSSGSAASITTLGYYVTSVLVFFIILNTIGINLTQLTVIFGALGIGIGFGLQTIMNNFISGIIILVEQVIKTGDIVNLENGLSGEVKKIAIRFTVIKTGDGEDVIVPNSEFVSGKVKSWMYSDDWRRLTIPFLVAQSANPEEIVRLAGEAAREVEITREDETHPILVFFEGFGENGLQFSLRVWCRMYQLLPNTGLHSDYYFVLHKKLKAAGIELPFPQRDLHLRSMAPEAADFRQAQN
ncbi:mechanosensitive ion channel family protein [Candidatus Electronema sp. PJ]|uniref:mechanosensitive ion channel family protein n=1 Tax=Candidatus Electronema sp. PJ TaxID=3401572 RepID=UPI003AA8E5A3